MPATEPSGPLPADVVKRTLTGRARELLEQSWFPELCRVEGANPGSVRHTLTTGLESLGREDNLYRLGEAYHQASAARARLRKIILLLSIAAVIPFAILLTASIIINDGSSNADSLFLSITATVSASFLYGIFLGAFLYYNLEKNVAIRAAYKRAATDIDRGMRSRVERTVQDTIVPKFDRPSSRVVQIGDGAKLSTRVGWGERIATRYRPAIELHMLRSGGAAVGITGERGTGKSELLRSFCEDPANSPGTGTDGTVGVLIAVPAAFQGAQFLALVAERLARAVPGYRTPEIKWQHKWRAFGFTGLPAGAILLALGIATYDGKFSGFRLTHVELGVTGSAVGGLLIFSCLMTLAALLILRLVSRNAKQPTAYTTGSGSASARSGLGREAERLLQRLEYAETMTTQGEGSFGRGGLGLKLGRQRTLSTLPLTEAALVNEIKTLCDHLGQAGYRVIIGIDEMDKLEAGQATEDFLNSIKQLFTISSCSFLVSVSSSAWARFVQRGVDVRDALDSSLDAIERIDALDFLETRSLIRHRQELMSDSEILFCYVLAGGFPREVMRCAQSLAISNRDEEGNTHRLDLLAGRVLDREVDRLIEAARSAVADLKFHDRDTMLRKFDSTLTSWELAKKAPLAADATHPAVAMAQAGSRALSDSQDPSDSDLILMRLELMIRFFLVVRRLFCDSGSAADVAPAPAAPTPTATPAQPGGPEVPGGPEITAAPPGPPDTGWRGDIEKICTGLAEVRRQLETDPTAAAVQLTEISRRLLHKEAEPALA